MKATVVLAGVESPFLVEELRPFASLRREPEGKPEEVDVVKQPLESEEERKGFFDRIFGQ